MQVLSLLMVLAFVPAGQAQQGTPDFNSTILYQIAEMPSGGDYMAGGTAMTKLSNAVSCSGTNLSVNAVGAVPSFCSSATYLVFLKAIQSLQEQGVLRLDAATMTALAKIANQSDGRGVWGRWNANGPGTARLFYELGLGPNFTDWSAARPGDFLKIFWRDAVGADEHGHSVIYLGTEMRDGVDYVRFWSSNKPGGYGE